MKNNSPKNLAKKFVATCVLVCHRANKLQSSRYATICMLHSRHTAVCMIIVRGALYLLKITFKTIDWMNCQNSTIFISQMFISQMFRR